MKDYTELPLCLIDVFPNHPYKVIEDDNLFQLADSIINNGLFEPIVVRIKDGRYQIISGHRRFKVYEMLNLTHIPAEVIELNDNDAIIRLVESNFYRQEILPSEKAFSYKLLLEARKQQGIKNETKFRSNEEVASIVKESVSQIKRYIRLTYLHKYILDLVDQKRIALRPAVELSYLSLEHQKIIVDFIKEFECSPSYSQAVELRHLEEAGILTGDKLISLMSSEKPNQKERISIEVNRIKIYLPDNITPRQTQEHIIKALKFYSKRNTSDPVGPK